MISSVHFSPSGSRLRAIEQPSSLPRVAMHPEYHLSWIFQLWVLGWQFQLNAATPTSQEHPCPHPSLVQSPLSPARTAASASSSSRSSWNGALPRCTRVL